MRGCSSRADRLSQGQLGQGYDALAQRQYSQAIAAADAYLSTAGTGDKGVAEALYLKGRAIEQQLVDQPTPAAQVQAQWQQARVLYVQALEQKPSPELEALIRAGIANVAFYQDDFQTALEQWNAASAGLKQPDAQEWVLYRMGQCQQRTGRFEEADRTYAAVQERYPGGQAAAKAKERQGARAFYVQLATFSSPASADRASAELKRQGIQPQRISDAQGRQVIRVGPLPTYAQAKAVKQRQAATYPDALIIP
jgi:outer membrane protein assembly factor BamD (BamD/ComL family)